MTRAITNGILFVVMVLGIAGLIALGPDGDVAHVAELAGRADAVATIILIAAALAISVVLYASAGSEDHE